MNVFKHGTKLEKEWLQAQLDKVIKMQVLATIELDDNAIRTSY